MPRFGFTFHKSEYRLAVRLCVAAGDWKKRMKDKGKEDGGVCKL